MGDHCRGQGQGQGEREGEGERERGGEGENMKYKSYICTIDRRGRRVLKKPVCIYSAYVQD